MSIFISYARRDGRDLAYLLEGVGDPELIRIPNLIHLQTGAGIPLDSV